MSIKVLIVDDHELARYALHRLLETIQELSDAVIQDAENGCDAVALALQYKPDIVIMDITMPDMNGIEATRKICQTLPHTKVIILSMHNRRRYLRELIGVGISGYILKTRVLYDIPAAIHSAMAGEIYYSPKVAALISKDYISTLSGGDKLSRHALSPRQNEVLQLIVEGKSTKEIAIFLGVSTKAVDAVRHRIMQKLEIDNIAGLTKYALQEGLTTLDF